MVTRWVPSELNSADFPSRADLVFGEEVVAKGVRGSGGLDSVMVKARPSTLASLRSNGGGGGRVIASQPCSSACPEALQVLGLPLGSRRSTRPPLTLAKGQMSTQKRCAMLLRRLRGWLCPLRLPRWSAEHWDVQVSRFLEHAFDSGLALGDLLKLPSALM